MIHKHCGSEPNRDNHINSRDNPASCFYTKERLSVRECIGTNLIEEPFINFI